ncbi:hypothetical protein XANCAGTX0491_003283 [Xanthoria calcicola]
MGLYSKLSASQLQGGYNAPPPQQQQAGYPPQLQAGPQPGAYAPSQQGPQYPPQQQQQYPPKHQQQYSPQHQQHYAPQHQQQYPPQQQQQYQQAPGQYGQQPAYQPAQANPQQVAIYKQLLQTTVRDKFLENMISPDHPALERYAHRAASQIDQLCTRDKIPHEIGRDLAKLALYDIILYIDNSGSMMDKDSERVDELRRIMTEVVNISMLFDEDGISIRFMNDWNSNPAMDGVDMRRLDNIKDERMIHHIVDRIDYSGLTPLGTELKNKVIDPMVLGPARSGQLQKPVLLITITDGSPTENGDVVQNVIQYASNELSRMPRYGPGAVAFQFAQVGNDQAARAWLAKLDSDPRVGHLVDCTSNFENEQEEFKKRSLILTRALWTLKMLLGSIDPTYDLKDEPGSGPPGGQSYGVPTPVPGSIGGPGGYPQQPPPSQQGSSGLLPQRYGQPPAGLYGQQGYGLSQPGYLQSPSQNYAQTPQSGSGQPPLQYQGQPHPQGYPPAQQPHYNPPPPSPRY